MAEYSKLDIQHLKEQVDKVKARLEMLEKMNDLFPINVNPDNIRVAPKSFHVPDGFIDFTGISFFQFDNFTTHKYDLPQCVECTARKHLDHYGYDDAVFATRYNPSQYVKAGDWIMVFDRKKVRVVDDVTFSAFLELMKRKQATADRLESIEKSKTEKPAIQIMRKRGICPYCRHDMLGSSSYQNTPYETIVCDRCRRESRKI